MKRSPLFQHLALICSLGLTACGASQGGTAIPDDADSQPAPSTWSAALSKGQKAEFMEHHVVPDLAPIFQAANSEEHADFGCVTCHGPAYKSPQEYLPALTLKDGNLTAFEEAPEVAKFMAEKVGPAMAASLGVPPYDPETHEGFGCSGCHKINAL